MATIDLRIQNRCDHRIAGESLALDAQRTVLVTTFPLASEGSLELFCWGEPVPKTGYSLEWITSGIEGEKKRVIVLANRDPRFKIQYTANYVTSQDMCPKCQGTLFADDLRMTSGGDAEVVMDLAQLAQCVEKAVVTDLGSNKYHRWVGCDLRSLVGSKTTDINFLETEMKSQIRSSIEKFKQTQVQHAESNPAVGVPEQLNKVTSIVVEQDQNDPTVFNVNVYYTSAIGTTMEFSTLIDLQNYRVR